jgi:hypothetical protein
MAFSYSADDAKDFTVLFAGVAMMPKEKER